MINNDSLRSVPKMKLSKCLEWNFKEFSFICNDPSYSSKVTKISCIICKEFYGENKNELDKLKGKVKEMVVRWIEGTDVIKKCNAETHQAPNFHTLAVQCLREKQQTASDDSSSSSTEAQRIAQSSSNITQTSIVRP